MEGYLMKKKYQEPNFRLIAVVEQFNLMKSGDNFPIEWFGTEE